MEIRWLGNSTFEVKSSAGAVVVDHQGALPTSVESSQEHMIRTSWCCRDRSPARSPFGLVEDSLFPDLQVTFPEAPLRSRTVGFPESGSDLGL